MLQQVPPQPLCIAPRATVRTLRSVLLRLQHRWAVALDHRLYRVLRPQAGAILLTGGGALDDLHANCRLPQHGALVIILPEFQRRSLRVHSTSGPRERPAKVDRLGMLGAKEPGATTTRRRKLPMSWFRWWRRARAASAGGTPQTPARRARSLFSINGRTYLPSAPYLLPKH